MQKVNLIGLYSPYPRSGKSTVASILEDSGFKVLSIASAIKSVAHQFLREINGTDEWTEKEGPIVYDKSPRYIFQTIGEWGRKYLSPDVWCDCTKNKIMQLRMENVSVVIDDIRTPAEYNMIKELGGKMVRINMKNKEVGDISEAQTKSFGTEAMLEDKKFDMYIENPMTGIDNLRAMIKKMDIVNTLSSGEYFIHASI